MAEDDIIYILHNSNQEVGPKIGFNKAASLSGQGLILGYTCCKVLISNMAATCILHQFGALV